MPYVRSVRTRRPSPRPRSRRRGRTQSDHIGRISRGGPGSRIATRPSGRSTHQPGAVPLGFGMDVADGMSHACLRLTRGSGMPRRSNRSRSHASSPGSIAALLPDRGRDRLARQVVRRRPEAARRDDQVDAIERLMERGRDLGEVVGQRHDPADGDAADGERACQLATVRVLRLTGRQLAADGEQLGGPDGAGCPHVEILRGLDPIAGAYVQPVEAAALCSRGQSLRPVPTAPQPAEATSMAPRALAALTGWRWCRMLDYR